MSYRVAANENIALKLNETDTNASIIQNIMIILNTWQGSVPLYREFGIPDKPMHKPLPVAKSMFYAQIQEAIERYEPRVAVVGISFAEDINVPDGLIPTVEVEIKNE